MPTCLLEAATEPITPALEQQTQRKAKLDLSKRDSEPQEAQMVKNNLNRRLSSLEMVRV
jgi:hypothetical protein